MSGSTTSTTFSYTGHTVTWTVPTTGLCDITAAGAKGGHGGEIDATQLLSRYASNVPDTHPDMIHYLAT